MPAFLVFLRAVPAVRWAQLAAVLLLAGAFAYFGVTIQSLHVQVADARTAQARAEQATDKEKAGRAKDSALAQAAAASAAVDALEKTHRILTDQQEIEDASNLIAKQRQAVVAAADAVHGSLLNAFRAAAPAPAAGGSGPAGAATLAGGAAGAAPRDLRADVFAEWDGRARTLEDTLDDEYRRHDACLAEYRSVQSRINAQRDGTVTR